MAHCLYLPFNWDSVCIQCLCPLCVTFPLVLFEWTWFLICARTWSERKKELRRPEEQILSVLGTHSWPAFLRLGSEAKCEADWFSCATYLRGSMGAPETADANSICVWEWSESKFWQCYHARTKLKASSDVFGLKALNFKKNFLCKKWKLHDEKTFWPSDAHSELAPIP